MHAKDTLMRRHLPISLFFHKNNKPKILCRTTIYCWDMCVHLRYVKCLFTNVKIQKTTKVAFSLSKMQTALLSNLWLKNAKFS